MGLLSYEEIVNKQKKECDKLMETVSSYKPLIHIAWEFGLRFSKNENSYWDVAKDERCVSMNYAQGIGTIEGLSLNLYLSENDSIIRDVGPIIESLKEHPKLSFVKRQDYEEIKWRGWEFVLKTNEKEIKPTLLVRAWYERAKKCNLVGTGRFEEIKEMVCEE
jgi:hypothetical protein